MRKNKPFVPHIGSLLLCGWIILSHRGREGLEGREEDISFTAWVSGLKGEFRRKENIFFLHVFFDFVTHPHKSLYCFQYCSR